MDEKEVVRLFLKNGFQLSRKALPLVLSEPEAMIERLKRLRPRPFIVSKELVEKVLAGVEKPRPEIRTAKEYKMAPKRIDVDEYLKSLHSYYDKMRSFLIKRMGTEKLVSINKITQKTVRFSIIGIVREKREGSILLEDPSGEITVSFDDLLKHELKEVFLDDVIGVRCRRKKGKFLARKLFFPDIPLNREINRSKRDVKIAIVSSPSKLDEKTRKDLLSFLSSFNPIVFLFDETSTEGSLGLDVLLFSSASNPMLFQLSGLKILVLPSQHVGRVQGLSPLDSIVFVLRKRHLPFTIGSLTPLDDFVLEEIPDIVVSDVGEGVKNYKGTTIVANSNPRKVFTIDLRTRDVAEKLFEQKV